MKDCDAVTLSGVLTPRVGQARLQAWSEQNAAKNGQYSQLLHGVPSTTSGRLL
jgi:hypothetical protein